MEINPHSLKADALGDLYRSALFMVKGQTNLSISFLGKANNILRDKLSKQVVDILNEKNALSRQNQLLLAEKILDEFHLQKISS